MPVWEGRRGKGKGGGEITVSEREGRRERAKSESSGVIKIKNAKRMEKIQEKSEDSKEDTKRRRENRRAKKRSEKTQIVNKFLVDLHIHSLLSPCGSLDMSPQQIVERALDAGLDAIAITDHNTLHQALTIEQIGEQRGLKVFLGVEITTHEEAHCVALLPDHHAKDDLQEFIDQHIIKIKNVPKKLGDQVWVDANDIIIGEVAWYLNSPLDCSVECISTKVKTLGGLFIAAHVERQSYSLLGQLGFIPTTLTVDALEFNNVQRFSNILIKNHELSKYSAYSASDAHYLHQIGENPSYLVAPQLTFEYLRKALLSIDGCKIVSKKLL